MMACKIRKYNAVNGTDQGQIGYPISQEITPFLLASNSHSRNSSFRCCTLAPPSTANHDLLRFVILMYVCHHAFVDDAKQVVVLFRC